MWTATTAAAAFFVIAEHCNREQFNALIGPCPGIVVSDRWNGYSHLDPRQRRVCSSHVQRDFRRHADGLGEQKTFGAHGFRSPTRCSPPGAPTSTSTHDRDRLQAEIAPIQTELRQQSCGRRSPSDVTALDIERNARSDRCGQPAGSWSRSAQ